MIFLVNDITQSLELKMLTRIFDFQLQKFNKRNTYYTLFFSRYYDLCVKFNVNRIKKKDETM